MERLLASDRLADNVISILAKVDDQREAVRRILGRIAASDKRDREKALAGFSILAGLRRLVSELILLITRFGNASSRGACMRAN
jgi:hypothetical protein